MADLLDAAGYRDLDAIAQDVTTLEQVDEARGRINRRLLEVHELTPGDVNKPSTDRRPDVRRGDGCRACGLGAAARGASALR